MQKVPKPLSLYICSFSLYIQRNLIPPPTLTPPAAPPPQPTANKHPDITLRHPRHLPQTIATSSMILEAEATIQAQIPELSISQFRFLCRHKHTKFEITDQLSSEST
ncbi:hypothetical protein Hanom_Chr17g01550741 [Helianthus anomalus]